MTDFIQTSASRSLDNAAQDHFIPAEAPWSGIVRKGQTIRIEDSYGQQAIDTLFYNAGDFSEHYSNQDTMREYGTQCVVWQTAINPVVALELLAAGTWSGAGVLGPEAFDAVPFLNLLADGYSSPWGLTELSGSS